MIYLPTATVDLDGLRLFRDGEEHTLTPQEARLLEVLARHVGEAVSREALLQEAMGVSPRVVTRALDAAISRLRAKLEPDPRHPRSLISVRGKGYRLDLAEAPTPVARPALRDDILGRDAARDEAHALLDHHRVVLLLGPGGIGKTTLADQLVVDRWGPGPGGRRLDLADAVSEDELLTALGLGLGLGDHPSIDRLLLSLDDDHGLWVFDNLEQLDDEATATLRLLVEGTRIPKVLTSRRPPWPDLPTVALGGLDEAAGMELLRRAARRANPRDPAEHAADALRALVSGVDGLPLALELLGAQLPRLGAEPLVRSVQRSLADSLTLGDGREGRHQNLARVIEASWATLPSAVQRTMAWWSGFIGPFDLVDADALRPPGGPSALVVLDALATASLLVVRDGFVHPWVTVGAFAAQQLDDADRTARDAALVDALAARCPDARWSDELVLVAHRPWILARRNDLLAAVWRANDPAVAARLALTLLMVGSQLPLATREALALRAHEAAQDADDPVLRVEAVLGQLRQGNWLHPAHEAHELLATVEPLLPEVPSDVRMETRYVLALYQRRVGEMIACEATLRDGVACCEAHDIPTVGARMLQELGATCRRTGRLDEAARHMLQALAQHRSLGETRYEAGCHISMAGIRRQQGRDADAQDHIEHAVALARSLGRPLLLANALNNLANVLTQRGLPGAREALDESIALSRAQGDRPGLAIALGGRGMLHDLGRDLLSAELDYREALALSRTSGHRGAHAFWTYRLADLAHRRGDLDQAEALYTAGIVALDGVNSHPARLHARVLHAMLLAEQHRLGEAEARLEEAAPLTEGEEDDKLLLATGRAAVARWRGDPDPDAAFAALGVARAALHRPMLFVAHEIFDRAPARG